MLAKTKVKTTAATINRSKIIRKTMLWGNPNIYSGALPLWSRGFMLGKEQ